MKVQTGSWSAARAYTLPSVYTALSTLLQCRELRKEAPGPLAFYAALLLFHGEPAVTWSLSFLPSPLLTFSVAS